MSTLSRSTARSPVMRELPERPQRRQAPAPAPPDVPRETRKPFLGRWLTAVMLLTAAVLATLYIANAIAVNDLAATITSLEHDRDAARSDNEKLRSELLKLMSVERMTTLAATRLGLVQPTEPPRELTSRRPSVDSQNR